MTLLRVTSGLSSQSTLDLLVQSTQRACVYKNKQTLVIFILSTYIIILCKKVSTDNLGNDCA